MCATDHGVLVPRRSPQRASMGAACRRSSPNAPASQGPVELDPDARQIIRRERRVQCSRRMRRCYSGGRNPPDVVPCLVDHASRKWPLARRTARAVTPREQCHEGAGTWTVGQGQQGPFSVSSSYPAQPRSALSLRGRHALLRAAPQARTPTRRSGSRRAWRTNSDRPSRRAPSCGPCGRCSP